MTGKKSFVLYSDLISTVSKLPDDKAGKLFKIVLDYVNDKNPAVEDLLLQIAFEPIKQQLKRDLAKWDNERSNRSESGRLGGLKSGETRRRKAGLVEANEAGASKTKQNEANEAVTVNVTVTDSVTVLKGKGHFENMVALYKTPYLSHPESFRDSITEKDYIRFNGLLNRLVNDFPEVMDKFNRCMTGQDWIKHLKATGYAILKPAIEKMLCYKVEPTANMALKIKQFTEKEENGVLKNGTK